MLGYLQFVAVWSCAKRVTPFAIVATLCAGSKPCWSQGKLPPVPVDDPRTEPLVTDRPDFTESALTIPPGLSQAEFGSTITRNSGDKESAFGEMLLRIGVSPRAELRLGLPTYLTTRRPGTGRDSGFSDASLGAKFSLARAREGFGLRQYDVGLIIGSTLLTGSSAYRGKHLQPSVKLLLASALNKTVSLSANLNYDLVSDDQGRYGEASSSVSAGFAAAERVGIYAEYFGFYPSGSGRKNANYVNTGITYLVSNNLQLDTRVGKGLNGVRNDYFVGAGASRRF